MKISIAVCGRFHAFDLARELDRRDELGTLWTSYPQERATAFGIPSQRIASLWPHEAWNRIAQRFPGPFDLRDAPLALFDRRVADKLSRSLRPDVVIAWSGAALRTLETARELGALAVCERGSTHIQYQDRVLRREYERLGVDGRVPHPRTIERELREYELADRITVPSRFVAQTFVEAGVPAEKIVQVPYGVALEAFEPPVEPRDSRFRVLYVGNLSLRKGCHLLLEAFTRMRADRFRDAELHLVGPVAEEILPFLARYEAPNVHVHGRLPQSELVEHYQQATVFCLPSFEEGLAMVVPQAMACGLPIVATEATGAGELVSAGVEGHFVPAGDVEALTARLADLAADRKLCETLGRAALERARSRPWSDYASKLSRAYLAAITEPKSMSGGRARSRHSERAV